MKKRRLNFRGVQWIIPWIFKSTRSIIRSTLGVDNSGVKWWLIECRSEWRGTRPQRPSITPVCKSITISELAKISRHCIFGENQTNFSFRHLQFHITSMLSISRRATLGIPARVLLTKSCASGPASMCLPWSKPWRTETCRICVCNKLDWHSIMPHCLPEGAHATSWHFLN